MGIAYCCSFDFSRNFPDLPNMKEIVDISGRSVDDVMNQSIAIKSQAKYKKARSEFDNYGIFECKPTSII